MALAQSESNKATAQNQIVIVNAEISVNQYRFERKQRAHILKLQFLLLHLRLVLISLFRVDVADKVAADLQRLCADHVNSEITDQQVNDQQIFVDVHSRILIDKCSHH